MIAVAAFLTHLQTEAIDDTVERLQEDLLYASVRLQRVVKVPAGFETDYASVPRLPFAYLLFGGIGKKAAVIHDFLYRTAGAPRADADAVFLEAMRATGVVGWRRWAMYLAVRAFGWEFYRDDLNQPEGEKP